MPSVHYYIAILYFYYLVVSGDMTVNFILCTISILGLIPVNLTDTVYISTMAAQQLEKHETMTSIRAGSLTHCRS